MGEHPIQQPIREIDVFLDADNNLLTYTVGRKDVTRIEACQKSGMHANIPYVRVWRGDVCEGEFYQHNIVGVYFGEPEAKPAIGPKGEWLCAHGIDAFDCLEHQPF